MGWYNELNEANRKIDQLQCQKAEKAESFSEFALQSLLDWKKDIERKIQRMSLKAELKNRLETHVSNHKELMENEHKNYEQMYEAFTMVKNNLAGSFDSKSGKKVQEQSEDKRKRVSTGEELAYDLKKTCTTKGWF